MTVMNMNDYAEQLELIIKQANRKIADNEKEIEYLKNHLKAEREVFTMMEETIDSLEPSLARDIYERFSLLRDNPNTTKTHFRY